MRGARGLNRLLVKPSGPGALLMGVSLMAVSICSMLMLNSGCVYVCCADESGFGCGSGF